MIALLAMIGCSGDKYNYVFYLSDGSGGKLIGARGNINNSRAPEGDFVIYDNQQNIAAMGVYENGLKTGPWTYIIEEDSIKVLWKQQQKGLFKINVPSNWILKDDENSVLNAFGLNEDSLIDEKFVIKQHDLDELGVSDFDEYAEFYRIKIQQNDLTAKVDYSKFYTENYECEKVKFVQYSGNDKSGDPTGLFSVLLLLPGTDGEEALEIIYITPSDSEDYYRLFTEVLLDIHYNSHPLFNRWGLGY